MQEPVAITGLGVVSPLGALPDFWQGLCAGRSGIGPLTAVDSAALGVSALQAKIAAEVKDFKPSFNDKRVPLMDRVSQFAVEAAHAALADSGLVFSDEMRVRTATILGCGVGGQNTQDDNYQKLYLNKAARVHPFTIPRLMVNAPPSLVSIELGLMGPAFTIASACASGTHALGVAMQMIQSGQCDIAFSGGADACITYGTLRGWEALRVMSTDACRPFSAGRSGMVLGEGAAILVLEKLSAAKARGARIYALLAGFGQSSDAKDITSPDEAGCVRAMRQALQSAAFSQLDYINAHGTGTTVNDATETQVIKTTLGADAAKVPVSSIKSMVGHALGAAGALEAAATALAIYHGVVPPTINYLGPDDVCDLDYVPNIARTQKITTALSNSFAFGGLNAVIALKAA